MSETSHYIVFNSEDLPEQGKGLRFALPALGEFAHGFVVRYRGLAYAYVNQCAHLPVELDWNEAEFFTADKEHLICATHGAHYRPDNGYCVMGPCKGKRLKPIPLTEDEQKITIDISAIT